MYSTQLLSDYEWALAENVTENSESENEEVANDQAEVVKDQYNVVFQELEVILSHSSFVHGRTFETDLNKSIHIMNAELKKSEELESDGVVIDTGANRSSVMILSQFKA